MALNIDTFRSEVRRGSKPAGPILRLASGNPVPGLEGTRSITFTYSDESVDLENDVVKAGGWNLVGYLKNPIALFGHNASRPENIIGRSVNVAVRDRRLQGDIIFADHDTNPTADMVYRLYRGKFMRAVSVGFEPVDFELSTDKSRPGGIDFLRQNLLEISCVAIPCNNNALEVARSKGIDTRPMVRWAEEMLDTRSAPISRHRLEDVRRQAGAPRFVPVTSPRTMPRMPVGKSLPPVPKFPNIHPSMMLREANLEEFDALWEWQRTADAAPGSFTAAQRETREDVGKRIDLLRMFVWA